MVAKKSEEIRIPVSFKKTVEEIAIFDFIKKESRIIGQSNYVKQLVMEEMKKKGEWFYD